MSRSVHLYRIFETASGHAVIAWHEGGISALRLPASSPEAAERALLRRLPDAMPAEPPADVAAIIAAAQRYFAGEETDFSDVRIDLGEQERIWGSFYQIDRATFEDQGTGSGLAIVNHIAELHGGHTEVQSRLQEGSRFTISIPLTAESVRQDEV